MSEPPHEPVDDIRQGAAAAALEASSNVPFWRKTLPNVHIGLAIVGPFILFALFLLLVGANPLEIYITMIRSSFGDSYGFGEVVVKTTPILLTALATALPARAGLVNVGGEGQLAIGALTTTFAALYAVSGWPAYAGLPMLAIAGAAGGALWAGVAAGLRHYGRMNETITTLLLNYIAFYTVGYFVHGILKDPASFNWPFSPQIDDSLRLPVVTGTRIHLGVVIALALAVFIWWLLTRTRFGYRLKTVGGNSVAARLAGIPAERMQVLVLLAAGALAGLAGMIEITGIEGRLRPSTGVNYGYLGFLAAWMAWNQPLWIIGTALIIGATSVAGNALEMTSGLPSSAMHIFMAIILISILAFGRGRAK
ncbi:ABC transporter permease [Paenibacillus sp. sptzw28]|nr:ABC transporter permease [Paenibacillus sp. sptzw28]